MFKEKFSNLSLEIFNYNFYVYKIINDANFWYEIIAIKDNKEYYVCKLDYAKTTQGIKTFILKDIAATLKEEYPNFNFKVLKSGVKVNDKIFRLKKPNYYQGEYYDLKITIIQHITNLQTQTILVK